MQNDHGNHSVKYANTIVVAVSSRGRHIPFHVHFGKGQATGLTVDSWAKCEQVLTVSKDRLAASPRGRISAEQLREVDRALVLSLGIDVASSLSGD